MTKTFGLGFDRNNHPLRAASGEIKVARMRRWRLVYSATTNHKA